MHTAKRKSIYKTKTSHETLIKVLVVERSFGIAFIYWHYNLYIHNLLGAIYRFKTFWKKVYFDTLPFCVGDSNSSTVWLAGFSLATLFHSSMYNIYYLHWIGFFRCFVCDIDTSLYLYYIHFSVFLFWIRVYRIDCFWEVVVIALVQWNECLALHSFPFQMIKMNVPGLASIIDPHDIGLFHL